MRKYYLFYFLVLPTTLLLSQSQGDANSIFYKKSLTIYIRDLAFEGGIGGTFWFNDKYSTLLIINGIVEAHKYITNNGYITRSYIYINPIVTVRRHVFERNNLTPFIGVTVQPTWYMGDVSKQTEFLFGIAFGVEAWLTENISFSGEQSVLNRIPINGPWDYYDVLGRSAISVSFYF